MSEKSIWIINQYAALPQTGNFGRHYYIGKVFQKRGYKVTIVTATFTHKRNYKNIDNSADYHIEDIDGIEYIWIPTPEYKNIHGMGRIRNWFIFSKKLKKMVGLELSKPDVIYYSSLSLIGYIGAKFIKKYFKSILILEIRDIWPLTLQELKKLSKFNPFIFYLRLIEMDAYKNSEFIVSNLSNFNKYLIDNGFSSKKYTWIPNGFDSFNKIESLPYNKIPKRLDTTFRIGYAGALGVANNMKIFIDVANKLKSHNDIEFYILGDGPQKEYLKERCVNPNVYFLDKTSKKYVQSFLSQMDCCYIGWAESLLYNYGIGANKFLDYMLSGKPIIHAYSGEGDPVKMFNIGETVNPNDVLGILNAVLEVKKYTEERLDLIKNNSLNALTKYFDYNVTVDLLINDIDKSLG